MNRQAYQEIFERYPAIGNTPALEIGAWSNPWLEGSRITYMDRAEYQGYPDIMHDLEDLPLPFEDKQFKIVALREGSEHVCPKQQIGVMKELHRILSDKGILLLTVPFYKWHGAHTTPDHCKMFTEYSFGKYTHKSYRGDRLWKIDLIKKVREKDRLRYIPINTEGTRIKRPLIRKIIYRLLSYSPTKRYVRNLFVRLVKC